MPSASILLSVRNIQGALLHFGVTLCRDSLSRLRYWRAAARLRGPQASAQREQLKAQARSVLTPLGLGLTEWAASRRGAPLLGKSPAELEAAARRPNRFWNLLGSAGAVVGPALVLAAAASSVSRVSAIAHLAEEAAAWVGALAAGWFGTRLLSRWAVRIGGGGIPRLVGAALGGVAGSMAGDFLARVGAIILGEGL